MKIKIISIAGYSILFFSFFIESCGLSTAEIKKQEQQLIDSTKKATEEKTLHIVDSTNKLKDSLGKLEFRKHQKEIEQTRINSELLRLNNELEIQRAKLEDIQGFHIGRSAADKEKQIAEQVSVINSIKQNIQNLNDLLQRINSSQQSATNELSNVENLIGVWFVPHAATINIKFYRDGKFDFNDYNTVLQKEELLKGTYLLDNGSLTLLYIDRPKLKFRFYKGEIGDARYYLKNNNYYFVKDSN